MTKILYITDIGSPWGGSEELWSKSALLLKKLGYDIHASLPWYNQIHPKTQNLIDNKIKIHFRKNKLRFAAGKASELIKFSFLKRIKTNIENHIDTVNPDFIVFSQSHIFSAWKYMLYAHDKGIKYCVISQLNSELSWANDSNYKEIRKAFSKAEKSFFVSKGNLKLLETQLAFKLNNAKIISNPYNMDAVKNLKWPNSDELNIAFVGRLDFTHKGLDILLQSLSSAQWEKRKFKLNIYGTGNINLAKELVNHLSLNNKVFFHGHVNNIHDIWENNHILALASRYEGMPLVLIEAMFCKRPVIATDIAGHSELVKDGITGFLAEAPHDKLFSEKFEEVWNNKNHLEAMGQKAFNYISKKVPIAPEKSFAKEISNLI